MNKVDNGDPVLKELHPENMEKTKLLQELYKGHELFNISTGIFLWTYNEEGAIGYASFDTNEEAKEIARKAYVEGDVRKWEELLKGKVADGDEAINLISSLTKTGWVYAKDFEKAVIDIDNKRATKLKMGITLEMCERLASFGSFLNVNSMSKFEVSQIPKEGKELSLDVSGYTDRILHAAINGFDNYAKADILYDALYSDKTPYPVFECFKEFLKEAKIDIWPVYNHFKDIDDAYDYYENIDPLVNGWAKFTVGKEMQKIVLCTNENVYKEQLIGEIFNASEGFFNKFEQSFEEEELSEAYEVADMIVDLFTAITGWEFISIEQ